MNFVYEKYLFSVNQSSRSFIREIYWIVHINLILSVMKKLLSNLKPLKNLQLNIEHKLSII